MFDPSQRKTIGRKLHTFRDNARLSIRALAIVSGISESTISRIENGNENVHPGKIDELCNVFGYSIWKIVKATLDKIDEGAAMKVLNAYISKKENNEIIRDAVEKSQCSYRKSIYFLELLIKQGFLNKYRKVGEIQLEIKNQFGKEIHPSVLSNALKRKEYLMSMLRGKGNFKLYKYIPKNPFQK